MMKNIDSRATVTFNGDFFNFISMSQGMLNYAEPSSIPWYLAPDVRDEELGVTLRKALAESKKVNVAEFQKIFHSGIVQKLAEDRWKWEMAHYGYKSKREMLKKMACCWISVFDGNLEIQPTHHKTIDGYSGISSNGPEIIHIPLNSSDAQIGAALREGFTRCTSAVR